MRRLIQYHRRPVHTSLYSHIPDPNILSPFSTSSIWFVSFSCVSNVLNVSCVFDSLFVMFSLLHTSSKHHLHPGITTTKQESQMLFSPALLN